MPYFCGLEKQQPIYAGNPLVAVHSACARHEKAARKDYFLRSAAKKWMNYRIPSDFYLHQLLAKRDSLLKADTRTLASWCRKWGAMEHPMRYAGIPEAVGGSGWRKIPSAWSLPAMTGSDVFECFSSEHLRKVSEAVRRTESVRSETGDRYAISLQECRLAVQDVSEAVEFMNRIILDGDGSFLDDNGDPKYAYTPIALLNYGILNEWQVACRAVCVERAGAINLTNAICNQILASVMEPEPWRVCPQCGVPYKHYQHDSKDFGDGKRRTASAYCSAQCANAASSEAKGRSRNRIQH